VECGKFISLDKLGQTPLVALLADWAAVQTALEQLRDDARSAQAQLARDKAAVAAARSSALNHAPVLEQWRADLAAARRKLRTDCRRVTRAAQADVKEQVADFRRLQADAADAVSLLADRVQLASDQSRLNGEVYAAVERLLTDKAAIRNEIFHDRAAIKSLLESHPGYTAAMAAFKQHRAAFRVRLRADRAILKAAIHQLRRDEESGAQGRAPVACADDWKPFFG
jgi:DNA repair exonuclease SbcCD ATPase subunit